MAALKILMSNLGYLRGIDGRLVSHLRYAHRHLYAAPATQRKCLEQLQQIVDAERPDICCFVEIDHPEGAKPHTNPLAQFTAGDYPFFDMANKYGIASPLRNFRFTRGKSNAFLAKKQVPFEKLYFAHGVKKLIYKLSLPGDIVLYFAHFSLKRTVRARQLLDIRQLLARAPDTSLFMGDFNILEGLTELGPLLQDDHYKLLNDVTVPTFTFHRSRKLLDLCICSAGLTPRLKLRVIRQSFSDHDALLLEIAD